MSRKTVCMPALGMSQDTGIIVEWHKKTGDLIKKDETMMSVETDKTVMDIPSPCDGMIADILAPIQVPIAIGTAVAYIETDESLFSTIDASKKIPTEMIDIPDATADPSPSPTDAHAAELDSRAEDAGDVRQGAAPPAAPAPPAPAPAPPAAPQSGMPSLREQQGLSTHASIPADNVVLASPKAKYVAEQHGIDIKMLRTFQKLVEPYDSEDVHEYVVWKQHQGRENYVVLEAHVSLNAFTAIANTVNEKETRTDDLFLQLWLQIQSHVINQYENLKKMVYANNGAIDVTTIHKGVWKEFVVFDILNTQKHFTLEEHARGTSSFLLSYISHPNITTYRVSDNADIHMLLVYNEKIGVGTIHISCKEGLLQEVELLKYMESLIQVVEMPLQLLL